MAILLNSFSGMQVYLKPVHIMGRDPTAADTFLEHALCSRFHCVLRFQDGCWLVTDESKNGTFLNRKRLIKGSSVKIRVGDTLSFPEAEAKKWQLIDDAMPKPVIIDTTSGHIRELQAINLLPDEESAEVLLTQQAGGWIVEKGTDSYRIGAGEKLTIAKRQWAFYPNEMMLDTATQGRRDALYRSLHLHFDISLNEENVKLIAHHRGKQQDLGYKAHHYILMLLARHRLLDEKRRVSYKEQGWLPTEVLIQEMKIDANHLNILIYRARKSFEKLELAEALIERRKGEMRLCDCDMLLQKGDQRQHYKMPT